MLRIPNLEELKTLLLREPGLMDAVEAKDPAAIDDVRNWLRSVETALGNNRMPQAAEFSGLRAQLTLGRQGVLPAGLTVSGTLTKRKVRQIASAEVVRSAGALLLSAIASDVVRVDEADRVARQLVTAAQVKGLVPSPPAKTDRLAAVRVVWAKIEADVEIGQGALHIVSLLGPEDAVIALDRALTRDIWR